MGDRHITGVRAHTHTALYQAGIAVWDILGTGGPGADYQAVPGVTFTDPEIGHPTFHRAVDDALRNLG